MASRDPSRSISGRRSSRVCIVLYGRFSHAHERMRMQARGGAAIKYMKAALLREFGKPLTIDDVPKPEPAAGQVLIRVSACGACHSDVHLAKGEWEGFKSRMPWPLVLGHEVAGTVVATGSGV